LCYFIYIFVIIENFNLELEIVYKNFSCFLKNLEFDLQELRINQSLEFSELEFNHWIEKDLELVWLFIMNKSSLSVLIESLKVFLNNIVELSDYNILFKRNF